MFFSQIDFFDLVLEYELFVGFVIVKLVMGDIFVQKIDVIISFVSIDFIIFFGIFVVIVRNVDRKMKEECVNYVM